MIYKDAIEAIEKIKTKPTRAEAASLYRCAIEAAKGFRREKQEVTGKTYATIYADPNWKYANFGAAKHGAARAHYSGSAAIDEISRVPVWDMARRDATLFLWACNPKLDEAIDVMRLWGFRLVTSLPWVKTVPSRGDLAKGIGFWSYSASEHLLIGRRGNAPAPRYPKLSERKAGEDPKPDGLLVGDSRVFYARRSAHSRKPLSLIEWIEAYFPGPLLELYARSTRPGWTCMGHETGWHLDENGASLV